MGHFSTVAQISGDPYFFVFFRELFLVKDGL